MKKLITIVMLMSFMSCTDLVVEPVVDKIKEEVEAKANKKVKELQEELKNAKFISGQRYKMIECYKHYFDTSGVAAPFCNGGV